MRRELLIVGLGLIGGSAGIALRSRGWRVRYVDPHVDEDAARLSGAADERAAAIDGDLVLFATTVEVAVELLRETKARLTTSVCSVMQPLRDAARTRFVAGHPMAGSHEHGLAAARGDLFEGKRWFLDAHDDEVEALVRDCGAIAEIVDAREHDRAVALTSHLPQILSTALAAHLSEHEDMLRFAGSGLSTFLRLAGSDASVWQPVIDANRANIAPHAEEVARIVREILEGDGEEAFERAQRVWRKL
ncbi:MAG TPA: prephenate dehydrogenase/arogenate dehydrogenase family protein [Thermoanaerobaculia bacterium]|nr:prephenate dehydrogenase/arogenate dehydrogenase family protein [Thermoanaerobaculia bacterium]